MADRYAGPAGRLRHGRAGVRPRADVANGVGAAGRAPPRPPRGRPPLPGARPRARSRASTSRRRTRDRARALGARPLTTTGRRHRWTAGPCVRVEVATPSRRAAAARAAAAGGHRLPRGRRALRACATSSTAGIRGVARDPGRGRRRSRASASSSTIPRSRPADWAPRLAVLSLDIETDPAGAPPALDRAARLRRVRGAAADARRLGCARPARIPFASERELLRGVRAAGARARPRRPHRLERGRLRPGGAGPRWPRGLGVPLELGRGAGRRCGCARTAAARHPRRPSSRAASCSTASRCCAAPSSAWRTTRLDAVAREVLGEGKPLAGHGRAREEILRLFKEDRARLVEYNRTDARLALEILENAAAWWSWRSSAACSPACRSTAWPPRSPPSTSCTCRELGRRGRRGAQRRRAARDVEPQGGGHVLEPVPGPVRERGWCSTSEPLPEPHPHVPDRSPQPACGPGGPREDDRSWPRTAPPSARRARHPDRAARRAHAAARGGAGARATA